MAIVLWPPGLFARGADDDKKASHSFRSNSNGEGPEFFDDDLGPGGSSVTRSGC